MKTLKNRLEPSLLHFLQEILGDGEAEGITYYGVGMTEGTFGCRRLIREVIRDFGWREDFATAEAAALFRLLYLFLVADAAIVSLTEGGKFLLLVFTSYSIFISCSYLLALLKASFFEFQGIYSFVQLSYLP